MKNEKLGEFKNFIDNEIESFLRYEDYCSLMDYIEEIYFYIDDLEAEIEDLENELDSCNSMHYDKELHI